MCVTTGRTESEPLRGRLKVLVADVHQDMRWGAHAETSVCDKLG